MTEVSPDGNPLPPQAETVLGIQGDMQLLTNYAGTAALQGSYRETAITRARGHYTHLLRIMNELATLADGAHAVPAQVFDAATHANSLGNNLNTPGNESAAGSVLSNVRETTAPVRDTQNSVGHLGALAGSLRDTLGPLADTFDALEGHNQSAARGAQKLRKTSRGAAQAAAQYPPKAEK